MENKRFVLPLIAFTVFAAVLFYRLFKDRKKLGNEQSKQTKFKRALIFLPFILGALLLAEAKVISKDTMMYLFLGGAVLIAVLVKDQGAS